MQAAGSRLVWQLVISHQSQGLRAEADGVLKAQNRLAEAEPLSREALEILRAALPAGHPDIATGLNNLAALLQAQNKLAEAEFSRSLCQRRRTYEAMFHPREFTFRSLWISA